MSEPVNYSPDTTPLARPAQPLTPVPQAQPTVWPPQGFLLGRVSDDGDWGILQVYDGGNLLLYPNGEPVNDVRFPNQELHLKKYEWVVFQAKLAPRQRQRQRQNEQLIEARGGFVWPAQEQTDNIQTVEDLQRLAIEKAAGKPLTLFSFNSRLFLIEGYDEALEERLRLRSEAQTHDLDARTEDLDQREQSIKEDEVVLLKRRSDLDRDRQLVDHSHEDLRQQQAEVQQREGQLTQSQQDLEQQRQAHEDQLTQSQQELDQQRRNLEGREGQLVEDRSRVEQATQRLQTEQQEFEAVKQVFLSQNETERTSLTRKSERLDSILKKWGFRTSEIDTQQEAPIFCDSEPDLINHVRGYIAAKGYQFDPNTIANFYTCLKSGALVVLSGLSGTGKSSLARLFAEAVSAKFVPIAVKANWTDTADLCGFYNPDKKLYHSTPFLDALIEAQANPERLYLICLDEMNLSRVEYYLSDLLSVMEQKPPRLALYSRAEWELRDELLKRDQKAAQEGTLSDGELSLRVRNVRAYRHTIEIPSNVLICGTVNIDETTQPFSDKVLDRIQIMQFEHVSFADLPTDMTPLQPTKLTTTQLAEYRLIRGDMPIDTAWFDQINNILKIGGFHFAHRVKRQIEDYCAIALGGGIFTEVDADDIVDLQLLQKILPKLRGIRVAAHDRMFSELGDFCDERYPQTAEKLEIMERMNPLNYWEVFRHVDD